MKDILKSAKLLRNGDYSLDAIKLTAKEWEALKEFEKSADVVKTVDRGKDVGKVPDIEIKNPLSKKYKSHMNKHNIDSIKNQAPYLTEKELANKLERNSFFNSDWTREEINE